MADDNSSNQAQDEAKAVETLQEMNTLITGMRSNLADIKSEQS